VFCEVWFGFISTGLQNNTLLAFQDAAGNTHFSIKWTASGSVISLICLDANSVQVGSTKTAAVGDWVHFGVDLTVGGAGTVTVKFDDVTQLNAVSGDFLNGATATVSRVAIQNTRYDSQVYADDLLIQDASGALKGSGLHCVASYPTAAGDTTQFTPSAGSNWQNVDETDPNEDTDYNFSSTAAQLDLYNVTDLPAYTGNVLGGEIWMRARKDNGGTEQLKIATKTESVVYYGATEDMTNAYAMYHKQYLLNPNTGVAWTQTEANAAQIGAEVV